MSLQKIDFPLVSIVTPAYNQGEFLTETINSVLLQDYPNIEYIVLNDGSTDSTAEVLKQFSGKIIAENQTNIGQANTLNKGWAMAKGKYLGYLSSDDNLKHNAISELVKVLEADSQYTVAYCDFELMNAHSKIFRTVQAENYDEYRLQVDLVCQPGPGALFRREIFDKTGGWKGHLQQVPDFEFWLRASSFGPFKRVEQVLAEYRIHEGSASFKEMSEKRSFEIVDVMKSYWLNKDSKQAKQSISNAMLLAIKNNLQSGRYLKSVTLLSILALKQPQIFFQKGHLRKIGSGIFRRLIYKMHTDRK
jgi:glycosyltransferase involved in cell wall biosynthesis